MTLTGRELKVKVKFDYAHLAESILAESRDQPSSAPISQRPSDGCDRPPGGISSHAAPLAPSGELTTKRHQRRTRFNTTGFEQYFHTTSSKIMNIGYCKAEQEAHLTLWVADRTAPSHTSTITRYVYLRGRRGRRGRRGV